MCRNNSERGNERVSGDNGAWCGICPEGLFRKRFLTGKYQIAEGILEKRCGGPCKEYWPADTEFFYPQAGQPDGISLICKACFVEVTGRTAGKRVRTAAYCQTKERHL